MTKNAATAVLVTGSGGPLGVNLTRSLRRAPEPLRIIGTDANAWHLPLSLTDQTYLIPLAREREQYLLALEAIVASERVDVLLPTHPVEVRAVADALTAGRLRGVATALPRADVLCVADDKARTQQCLLRAGVPVPATMLLCAPEDVQRAFDRWGGTDPVWIRGSGAPGLGIGGAALPCRDPEVARAWIAHHDGWGKMAASEYLPGANLSWMAAFDHGRLLASGCRERLEYVLPHVSPSGITGAPAVSRTVERPDVADIGERSVRAVDDQAHGVYFVDLKENANGSALVTEINAGRCGTTIEAYTHAGINFPWLLVELALGRSLEERSAVDTDLYWIRTLDCGPALVRGDEGFTRYPREPSQPQEADEPRELPRSAVLFDMDGTLLDFEPDVDRVREALTELFAAAGYEDGFHPIMAGIDAAVALAGAEYLEPALALLRDAEVAAARLANARLGAARVIGRLQGAGWPIGILTDNARASADVAMETAGMSVSLERMQVVLTRDEATKPKPDPGGLLAAGERLLPHGGTLWYVGDSVRDVRAARAAQTRTDLDVRAVALRGGRSPVSELQEERPDALMEHLEQLLPLLGM